MKLTFNAVKVKAKDINVNLSVLKLVIGFAIEHAILKEVAKK